MDQTKIEQLDDKDWEIPVQTENGSIVRVVSSLRDGEYDDTIKPIVFDGELELLSLERTSGQSIRCFFEWNDVQIPFAPKGLDSLLKGLRDGHIEMVDGRFVGVFSFYNHTGYVSAQVADRMEKSKLK